MPTHGGGILLGRDGEDWKHEMMMMWGDDEMISFFLHSFYKRNFPRAWEEHTWLFCFALLWDFCFTPVLFVRILHLHIFLWKMRQTKEKFWQAWKLLAENLGAFWKSRRMWKIVAPNLCAWKIIAPNLCAWKITAPNLCAWKNVCAKPLRLKNCLRQTFALEKLFAPNLCAWKIIAPNLCAWPNLGGSEKLLRRIFALYKKLGGWSKWKE